MMEKGGRSRYERVKDGQLIRNKYRNISIAGHDLTCAQYCRNNIEPTTGAQRVCASFNFDGRETCYFFDDAAAPAGEIIHTIIEGYGK